VVAVAGTRTIRTTVVTGSTTRNIALVTSVTLWWSTGDTWIPPTRRNAARSA
jgi:hypothetical protein